MGCVQNVSHAQENTSERDTKDNVARDEALRITRSWITQLFVKVRLPHAAKQIIHMQGNDTLIIVYAL